MKSVFLAALAAFTCFFSSTASAGLEKEIECLARNIYFEARGESFIGKMAVAQVSINRSKDQRFPNTICSVVKQTTNKNGRVVCQFSWYCTNKRYVKIPPDSRQYLESEAIARLVLVMGIRIPSFNDALYFHAKHVNPNWGKTHVATVGNHIFYADNRR